MPIPVNKVINDEQLLDFALSHVCQTESWEVNPIAEQIIIIYIINDFEKRGQTNFTEEDIDYKYKELMADYLLTRLAQKGLVAVNINEDGEIVYNITPKGKDKVKNG